MDTIKLPEYEKPKSRLDGLSMMALDTGDADEQLHSLQLQDRVLCYAPIQWGLQKGYVVVIKTR